MISSIHKVPACPFTVLNTVSHCTDDRIFGLNTARAYINTEANGLYMVLYIYIGVGQNDI